MITTMLQLVMLRVLLFTMALWGARGETIRLSKTTVTSLACAAPCSWDYPVAFIIYTLCFLGLLLLTFFFLRKVAWNYGRPALVTEAERAASAAIPEPSENEESLTSASSSEDIDQRNKFSWLPWLKVITDDEIRAKCSEDMMNYLSFQFHIIGLLLVVWVLTWVIFLFNKFSGGNQCEQDSNRSWENSVVDDKQLMMYSGFAILYLLFTVYFMKRHTSNMHYKKDNLVNKRTLFVNGISKNADALDIKLHFEQTYENCIVLEVRLCYDVARLVCLETERKKAERNKKSFIDLQSEENAVTMINPKPCGHVCCCIKGCEQEEAIGYYVKLEENLTEESRKERGKAIGKPLGMAFVTFQNKSMTAPILKDFNPKNPKPSILSTGLRTHKWTVSYAPHPENIYWENLSVKCWWLRLFIINCIVLLLLFLLTTPTIFLSNMDLPVLNNTKLVKYLDHPVITQFISTLLLWSASALLPTIVHCSTFLEAHFTRSTENRIMVQKCYMFLIFLVLIVPSLVLSRGMFLPNNRGFFVNYVITAAFIGNTMDLLRLPWLLLHVIRLCRARSAKERRNVMGNQVYKVPFGQNYSLMMAIFTVVLTYSFTCPIIVPFGLMYMLLKHLADRSHMYYAYQPTKLDMKIHSGAVNQAMAAPIICLFWLQCFATFHSGFLSGISMFTFIVLVFAVIFASLSCICFGPKDFLSVHNDKIDSQGVDKTKKDLDHVETTQAAQQQQQQQQMYVPPVLQDPKNLEEGGSGSIDEEILCGQNEDFLTDEDRLI